MSAIYFHSPGVEEARVWGVERHHMSALVNRLTLAMLDIDGSYDVLLSLLPERAARDIRALDSRLDSIHALGTRLGYGNGYFQLAGQRIDFFEVALNTAVSVGDDAMRLCARLHGQCEIHGYVEGRHRAWLAGLIERGLSRAILRRTVKGHDTGWDGVIRFLRMSDAMPVVTSYSVTDGFPSLAAARVGGFDGEGDAWYGLPVERQWEMALAGIRAERMLAFTPDDWDRWFTGTGWTAPAILERAWSDHWSEGGDAR